MFKSIRTNLGLTFGLLIFIGLASVGTTLWVVRSQSADAVVINLAGRQRMLSQRVAKLALLGAQRGQAPDYLQQMHAAARDYEQVFQSLRDGGRVAYGDRMVTLPPTVDPAIRAQLERIWNAWPPLYAAARAVLENPPGSAASARGLADLGSLSESLLIEIDRAVQLYEAAAAARVARVERIQLLFLLAGALVVAFGLGLIQTQIIRPLAVLGARVLRVIGNDLVSPVPVVTRNEIGALAASFDEMRGRLLRRFEEQAGLLKLSQDLLGVLEPEAVARATFPLIRDHLQPDAISLLVADAAGRHLELAAAEGWAREHVGRLRLPLEPPQSSGAAWAARTRTAVFEDHTRADQPFQVPEVVLRAGVRVCLSVPMLAEDRVIGVVVLDSLTHRTFGEEEVRYLSLVANQTALAYERARMYAHARERLERLSALHEIDVAITADLNLEKRLSILLEKVAERLHVDAAAVALVNPTTKELTYAARRGLNSEFFQDGLLREGEGIAGRVAQAGEPAAVADVRTEPRFVRRPVAEKLGIVSYLAVPLRTRSGIIGLLELATRERRAFSPEEVDFFVTLAGQAAIAIENARLFERVRLFKEAFDSAADVVMITDPQARILDVNPAFERITGFSRDEALGQKPSILKSRHTTPEFYQQMWAQILGQGHWSGEIVNRRKSGEEWDAFLAISTVRNGIGRPVSYAGIARDVTAMKRLQREREALFEAEVARRAELAALYDLSRALADAAYDLDAVLGLVVRRAVETVQVTFARVALVEGGDCVVRAACPVRVLDRDLGVGRREAATALPTCYRAAQQDALVVLRHDDPTLTDAEREALFLGIARTLCLVPLRAGERPLGLLMLGEARGEEREPFTDEKVRLARSIGDQAASAVHRAELFMRLERAYLETALALANAVDARDTYTADHAQRLAAMALAVGREMGLSPRELEDLRYGAILHDIGKIGIPDAVLQKPAALTAEEWALMRQHPVIGEQILAPVSHLAGVARIVRHHHERFDGTGYPDRLAGEAIPPGARILSVVDTYIAMIDRRVYRQAHSHEEAVAEIERCAGTQFDVRVVEVFLRLLERGIDMTSPARGDPSPEANG